MRDQIDSWIVDGNGFEKSWDVSDSSGSIATVQGSRKIAELISSAPEMLEVLTQILNNKQILNSIDVELARKLMRSVAKATGTDMIGDK
jgi:hypothetical protein